MPDAPACCTAHLKQTISFVSHACTCRARVITAIPRSLQCWNEALLSLSRSDKKDADSKLQTQDWYHKLFYMHCLVEKWAAMKDVWTWSHSVRGFCFKFAGLTDLKQGVSNMNLTSALFLAFRVDERSGASGFYVTVCFKRLPIIYSQQVWLCVKTKMDCAARGLM